MDFLFKLGNSFDEKDKKVDKKDDKEKPKQQENDPFASFTNFFGWHSPPKKPKSPSNNPNSDDLIQKSNDDVTTNANTILWSPDKDTKDGLEMKLSPGGGTTHIKSEEQNTSIHVARVEQQKKIRDNDYEIPPQDLFEADDGKKSDSSYVMLEQKETAADSGMIKNAILMPPQSILSNNELKSSETHADLVEIARKNDDANDTDGEGYDTSFEELPGSEASSPERFQRILLPANFSEIAETSIHSSSNHSSKVFRKSKFNDEVDEDSIDAMYVDSDEISDYSESILNHADSILDSSNDEKDSFDEKVFKKPIKMTRDVNQTHQIKNDIQFGSEMKSKSVTETGSAVLSESEITTKPLFSSEQIIGESKTYRTL